MKTAIIVFVTLFATMGFAQEGEQIKSLSAETNDRIQNFQDYDQLSKAEKRSIRSELLFLQQLLDDMGFSIQEPLQKYSCAKQSNGRFFPVNAETFNVVGSTSSNASYFDIKECKASLPEPGSIMACAKWSNGRFYPISSEDFKVKGSTSSNASYPNIEDCKMTLPQPGQTVTCAKQSNGRFFPVNVETYTIIGSTSSNASYSTFEACYETL